MITLGPFKLERPPVCLIGLIVVLLFKFGNIIWLGVITHQQLLWNFLVKEIQTFGCKESVGGNPRGDFIKKKKGKKERKMDSENA